MRKLLFNIFPWSLFVTSGVFLSLYCAVKHDYLAITGLAHFSLALGSGILIYIKSRPQSLVSIHLVLFAFFSLSFYPEISDWKPVHIELNKESSAKMLAMPIKEQRYGLKETRTEINYLHPIPEKNKKKLQYFALTEDLFTPYQYTDHGEFPKDFFSSESLPQNTKTRLSQAVKNLQKDMPESDFHPEPIFLFKNPLSSKKAYGYLNLGYLVAILFITPVLRFKTKTPL